MKHSHRHLQHPPPWAAPTKVTWLCERCCGCWCAWHTQRQESEICETPSGTPKNVPETHQAPRDEKKHRLRNPLHASANHVCPTVPERRVTAGGSRTNPATQSSERCGKEEGEKQHGSRCHVAENGTDSTFGAGPCGTQRTRTARAGRVRARVAHRNGAKGTVRGGEQVACGARQGVSERKTTGSSSVPAQESSVRNKIVEARERQDTTLLAGKMRVEAERRERRGEGRYVRSERKEEEKKRRE